MTASLTARQRRREKQQLRISDPAASGRADLRGKRGWLYLRQSVDNADGIDRQEEDTRRLCEREGVVVDRVIKDNDETASEDKWRPGFDGVLLPGIEAGECDVVVAQVQDRLTRRLDVWIAFTQLVTRFDVPVLLDRGHIDLTTAQGRSAAHQGALWAQTEVEIKAERQMRAEQQAAERGLPPARRAFGYRRVGSETVVDEAEARAVRAAFDLLFAGASITEIVRAMNATGLPTTRGGTWERGGVRNMLTNPRYAGLRAYYGREGKRAGEAPLILSQGTWEPIITLDEHHRAIELLADPSRKSNHIGTARKYLGSNLYFCGVCEAETGKLGPRVRSFLRANNGGARAYNCTAQFHLSRKAEPIDFMVCDAVEEWLARAVAEGQSVADLLAGGTAEIAPLREQENDLDARLEKALDRLDRGVMDEDDFMITKRKIEEERAVIRRKRTALGRRTRLAAIGGAADPVAAFRDADLAGQREVIDVLMDVVIHGSRSKKSGQFDATSIELRWRD